MECHRWHTGIHGGHSIMALLLLKFDEDRFDSHSAEIEIGVGQGMTVLRVNLGERSPMNRRR